MTTIDPHIFRSYDIRGKALTQLTEDAARKIGHAFGSTLRELYKKDHPVVVLGRDPRTHGPQLEEAAREGLVAAGCEVLLMGMTPSPLNYYTVCALQLDGGVQISASHNPKDDNGMKLQLRDAVPYSGEQLQDLRKRIEAENFLHGEGSMREIDAIGPYIDHLSELFKGVGNGRTIVVDSGNGAAGPLYKTILERVGCTVIGLYIEPDGEFPNHQADPSQRATLRDLQALVIKEGASLGFAYDGDGDRVGVVDETGAIRNADDILLLLSQDYLSRNPGRAIVYTVCNSGALETEVKKWGGVPAMCKVGHSSVQHALHDNNAQIGGELSGHYYCAEDYYEFDDAIVASLRILKALGDRPVTTVLSEFPKVYQLPEMRPYCPDDKKGEVVRKSMEHFSALYPVNTLDGARIDFGDAAWAIVRQSNTSPCLTVCGEARTPEKLEEVRSVMMDYLQQFPEIDWERKH